MSPPPRGNNRPPFDEDASRKYMDLDPKLREFLESMDSEDVETAKALLKTYRNAGIISRFMKWIIITAFVIFSSIAGIWEKIGKFIFTGKAG